MRKKQYFGGEAVEISRAAQKLARRMARSLAAEGQLTAAELEDMAALFPRWKQGEVYGEGDVVRTEEGVFRLNSEGHGNRRPSAEGGGWTRLEGRK